MKIILLIIIIFMYHIIIQNGIEKLFSKIFIKNEFIKRPLFKDNKYNKLCHIGMPSGHAETITILCTLLYSYKYINLYCCIFIILVVSLQRVISKKHTFIQVIFGIIMGLLYSLLYNKLGFNSLIIVLLLGFIIILFIMKNIDNEIHQPLPAWVDECMIPSINKKRNMSLLYKLCPIYINTSNQDKILFNNWKELENHLDIIIDKIKKTNIKFDAVVGIKTGGAIISDYISKKLGLVNYKIKIEKEHMNFSSYNLVNTLYDFIQKYKLKNYGKYKITEKINDNLNGKNIILIDESVESGITMDKAIKYLKKKKANIIKPYCISHLNKLDNKFNKNDIDFVFNDNLLIWPWGYDN